jgi:hypothetical protein
MSIIHLQTCHFPPISSVFRVKSGRFLLIGARFIDLTQESAGNFAGYFGGNYKRYYPAPRTFGKNRRRGFSANRGGGGGLTPVKDDN